MANEYEITEIGYIGSVWQGSVNSPQLVGRAFEVLDVPSTIYNGGYKTSIYFASDVSTNLPKLTTQLPESDMYYKIGTLPEKEVQTLESSVRLDPKFTRNAKVLFRYSKKYGESIESSRIPIQDGWSFDLSNPNSPKYIYNVPESIIYAPYIFLIDDGSLNSVKEYFLSIEQVQSVLDNRTLTYPPTNTAKNIQSLMPPIPIDTVPTFRPPPLDHDLFAEDIANKQFIAEKPNYVITSIQDFNDKMNQIEIETTGLLHIIKNTNTALPFTDNVGAMIRVKLLMLMRNYLIQQLGSIASVGTPQEDPFRYQRDEDGNIFITDPPIESNQVDIITNMHNDDLAEFDELIDDIIQELSIDDNSVSVYKRISQTSDYSAPILRYNTAGLFNCVSERISTFFTGSLSDKMKSYYLPVYSDATTHEFDIGYAHKDGSGSSYVENSANLLPAKTMYSKIMLECFSTMDGVFRFKNDVNGNYFYTIQFDRSSMRDGIDVGNFELHLSPLVSNPNQLINTGSGYYLDASSTIRYSLIDDSIDSKQVVTQTEGIREYYYIVSGSIRNGVYSDAGDNAWGVVFPKMGLIVLDGVVLDQSCSFNTVTASIDGDNIRKLFVSLSGSSVPTAGKPVTASFFARSVKTDLTETYFCRADLNDFNYSSNYTYTTGSSGYLKYNTFAMNPHSYITTIGLYNKQLELLAVGKIKNPILKNSKTPYVFQVKVRLN